MNLSIKIDVFEGPLDLLLHLIDKNKVTITDIPIALITDQYLEYMDLLSTNRMETMSEFVEMAATLIRIKTRMLLPVKKDENNVEIDPRQELMEQLLEYKKYKLIAEQLKDKQIDAGKVFFKKPSIPEEIEAYVPKPNTEDLLKELDFSKLYLIFQQTMKKKESKIDPIRSQFGTIKRENFTVHDKMSEILKLKETIQKFSFRELLEKASNKSEMIASFLAILELMKISKIRVVQVNVFHDIDVEFV